jgi:hypothetical protein
MKGRINKGKSKVSAKAEASSAVSAIPELWERNFQVG